MAVGGSYTIGNGVRLSAQFYNGTTLTDPTEVRCRIIDPTGAETVRIWPSGVGITRDATGTFHADVTPTIAGIWHYRWQSSGQLDAANEGAFTVPASPFS